MVAEYVWQQFIDSIDDIIDAIVNTLPSFIDEIIDFFLGLIDGILETIGIKTFVEAVINTLGIVWQTIIDILTGLYNTFNYFLTIAAIFACVAVPAIWLYVGLNAATTTNNVFSFFDKFFQLLASHVAPKFNIQGYAIEVQLYMLLFPATIIVCALAAVYA